jgi:hypothetical protein
MVQAEFFPPILSLSIGDPPAAARQVQQAAICGGLAATIRLIYLRVSGVAGDASTIPGRRLGGD